MARSLMQCPGKRPGANIMPASIAQSYSPHLTNLPTPLNLWPPNSPLTLTKMQFHRFPGENFMKRRCALSNKIQFQWSHIQWPGWPCYFQVAIYARTNLLALLKSNPMLNFLAGVIEFEARSQTLTNGHEEVAFEREEYAN